MATAVELDRVSKCYGPIRALDHVSLTVKSGEWLGIRGPNGAGKSTLLWIVSTLTRPTDGRVILFDDPAGSLAEQRRRIGMVTALPLTLPLLTVRENIELFRRLHGSSTSVDNKAWHNIAERLGLTPRFDHRINTLSSGYRKRVSIVLALMHHPQLILFDEPFSSLDQKAIKETVALLHEAHGAGSTVLVVSHNEALLANEPVRWLTITNGRAQCDS